MGAIASTIRAMKAAGVSSDQIVEAVLHLAQTEEEALAERRERDRQRKQADREARKSNENNDRVQRTSRTAQDNSDTPSPEVSPQTPFPNPNPTKKTPPTEGQKKVPATRGTRLPDDWEPDIGAAMAEGLSEARAHREGHKFRDYWRSIPGQKGVKLDWPATWRNWCRNAIDRGGNAANRQSDRPSMHDVADRMLRDAEERVRGSEPP